MMSSLFRPATDLMAQYAAYHRDRRRNIATHFVGIPLIVFAVVTLLARAGFAGQHRAQRRHRRWGPSALWYLTRGNPCSGPPRPS